MTEWYEHPPNPPPVRATGWGLQVQRARIATGLHTYDVANRVNIASGAFGSMVDRLEALPDAPDDPGKRMRAARVMAGFGLDPADFGIGPNEFSPEDIAELRRLMHERMAGDIKKRPAHRAAPERGLRTRFETWVLAIVATAVWAGFMCLAAVVGTNWNEDVHGWFDVARLVVSAVMVLAGIFAWIAVMEALGFDMSDNE